METNEVERTANVKVESVEVLYQLKLPAGRKFSSEMAGIGLRARVQYDSEDELVDETSKLFVQARMLVKAQFWDNTEIASKD